MDSAEKYLRSIAKSLEDIANTLKRKSPTAMVEKHIMIGDKELQKIIEDFTIFSGKSEFAINQQ